MTKEHLPQSGYYEGILQLRNRKNSSYELVLRFVRDSIEKTGKVFISKEKILKDGIDLYISSNKYLVSLGKKLHISYGAEIKMSKKLFSRNRQTSKEVYRVTVLARLQDYGAGDIIVKKNSLLMIRNIQRKKISGIDLATFNRKSISGSPDEILPTENIHNVLITKRKPSMEILDPGTFQSERVCNPHNIKEDHVRIIKYNNKIYLLPN